MLGFGSVVRTSMLRRHKWKKSLFCNLSYHELEDPLQLVTSTEFQQDRLSHVTRDAQRRATPILRLVPGVGDFYPNGQCTLSANPASWWSSRRICFGRGGSSKGRPLRVESLVPMLPGTAKGSSDRPRAKTREVLLVSPHLGVQCVGGRIGRRGLVRPLHHRTCRLRQPQGQSAVLLPSSTVGQPSD